MNTYKFEIEVRLEEITGQAISQASGWRLSSERLLRCKHCTLNRIFRGKIRKLYYVFPHYFSTFFWGKGGENTAILTAFLRYNCNIISMASQTSPALRAESSISERSVHH